jgi:hypothetical protein
MPKSTRKSKGCHNPADRECPFLRLVHGVSLDKLYSEPVTKIKMQEQMYEDLSPLATSSEEEQAKPKNISFTIETRFSAYEKRILEPYHQHRRHVSIEQRKHNKRYLKP